MFNNSAHSLEADINWVRRIVHGDTDAEEYFFRQYRERIRIFILYKLDKNHVIKNNPAALEDLLHEVCVGVLESIRNNQYDPAKGASVYTYICRIAYNKFIDLIKKNSRNMSVPLPDPDCDKMPVDALIQPVNLEMTERQYLFLNAIDLCLKKLNPIYRDAIKYRFFEELSIDEICLKLNLTPGQVSSRLSDGIEKLQKNLPQWLKNHPYLDYIPNNLLKKK